MMKVFRVKRYVVEEYREIANNRKEAMTNALDPCRIKVTKVTAVEIK